MTDKLKLAVDAFRDKLVRAEEKRPPRKLGGMLADDTDPEPLYTPLDAEATSYLEDLGFPGEEPFTRGVQPNMYRGRYWTMRQYAGFGTAAATNKRYHFLLDKGQTGLSVAFDLPTQIGYDSDHTMSRGEIGKVGVAIDSIEDVETLFDGIPLDKVTTSMTINSTASILLGMYIAVAKRRGIEAKALGGTVQNDILKEYIARGTYIYPPTPSMRLVTDIFRYCGDNVPRWNTISISGYHMREAGCDAIQEVAFTIADGLEYVKAAVDMGLDVDRFGSRLSFFFNCHSNFLEEIAKFRAARRLWARLMKDRFGATSPKAMSMRFHTQTAGCSLTAQQPLNNVVRVTLQAMAAALGGTQSLHTNSFDEALALPTEQAVRVALRTQQVIAHESGVADFVDALGGSYAIEALTNRIEDRAVDYIRRIDEIGGMVQAIEAGFVQKEIQNTAYAYQLDVEKKRKIVVGVNKFQEDESTRPDVLRVNEEVGREQVQRLQAFRARRDAQKHAAAIKTLEDAASTPDAPVFERILDAVEADATIGEISDVLRKVFGEYKGAPLI
ncbi:MAG: methylmalonyl-CoA mutase [Deltaproteobacteria bacterium]|nr:methylmalonyl-CoA mutase [Deltaproteobacteria bacterium]